MNKFLKLISAVAGSFTGLGIAGACLAQDDFISITEGFVTSSLAYIGQAVSGIGPLLYFVVGAPIAFWVIRKVIGLVPKR